MSGLCTRLLRPRLVSRIRYCDFAISVLYRPAIVSVHSLKLSNGVHSRSLNRLPHFSYRL